MRIELFLSIISSLLSAVQIRTMARKGTSQDTSRIRILFSGIFSWIFLVSTMAWMTLFGDTLSAWLTFSEGNQLFSVAANSIIFLFVYLLSFRPKAPYPIIEILDFAITSLTFQSAASASTNKLIQFLKKRAFDQFLKETQPDSQDIVAHQRENLVEQLRREQVMSEGLKQLEKGLTVEIIQTNTPLPPILSQHPLFQHLEKLTIHPKERKAKLQVVYPQIEECSQSDGPARPRFLRLVYDFIQAVSHEHFLKQYASFFDTFTLSVNSFHTSNTIKNIEESDFLIEITTAVLKKIESTYFNPQKLHAVAHVHFQADSSCSFPKRTNNLGITAMTPHQGQNLLQHPSTSAAA